MCSLVDDGQAAKVALNGAAIGDAHSCQAARNVAGLDGCLAVHCQRAVAIA